MARAREAAAQQRQKYYLLFCLVVQVLKLALYLHVFAFCWSLLASYERSVCARMDTWPQKPEIQFIHRHRVNMYLASLNSTFQTMVGKGYFRLVEGSNNVELSFLSVQTVANVIFVLHLVLPHNRRTKVSKLLQVQEVKLQIWDYYQKLFSFSKCVYQDIQSEIIYESQLSFDSKFNSTQELKQLLAYIQKGHKLKHLFEMFQLSFPKFCQLHKEIKSGLQQILPTYSMLDHNVANELYNQIEFVVSYKNTIINIRDSVYILLDGVIDVYYSQVQQPDQFNPVNSILINSIDSARSRYTILGEEQFILGQTSHIIFAIALRQCAFLKINRQDYQDLIQRNSLAHQKFCEIKDRLLFSQETDFLKNPCLVCLSKDHLTNYCLKINYYSQCRYQMYNFIIKIYSGRNLQRRRYAGKRLKKCNSFSIVTNLKMAASQVLECSSLSAIIKEQDQFSTPNKLQEDYNSIYDPDKLSVEFSDVPSCGSSVLSGKQPSILSDIRNYKQQMDEDQVQCTPQTLPEKNAEDVQNHQSLPVISSNQNIKLQSSYKSLRSHSHSQSQSKGSNISQSSNSSGAQNYPGGSSQNLIHQKSNFSQVMSIIEEEVTVIEKLDQNPDLVKIRNYENYFVSQNFRAIAHKINPPEDIPRVFQQK